MMNMRKVWKIFLLFSFALGFFGNLNAESIFLTCKLHAKKNTNDPYAGDIKIKIVDGKTLQFSTSEKTKPVVISDESFLVLEEKYLESADNQKRLKSRFNLKIDRFSGKYDAEFVEFGEHSSDPVNTLSFQGYCENARRF